MTTIDKHEGLDRWRAWVWLGCEAHFNFSDH